MKFLVFIACLLALAYAGNPEKLKEFHDHFVNCAQELNKPQDDADVAHCVLQNEGLIDEKGMFLMDKGFTLLDDLISDEAKRNEAKEIIRKCHEEAGYDTLEDIGEKTMKGIQCGMIILPLLDKM